MPLVIVESPAKCSKIREFLGSSFDVIASMGHIRALEQNLDAVGIDRDFEPRFELIKEKSKAIAQIREMAKKHTKIILAADDDREGEAIAYSVCVLLKLNPDTTDRAVFHEITKEAVTNAVANPRRLNMNKVYAQQSRAVLDMLVGFTLSRLLWNHVGQALSAGRCQTPALRLVAEKEEAISKFSSTCAWKVHGKWAHGNTNFEAFLTDNLEDQESASNYLEMCIGQLDATVVSAFTKPTTEQPPLPLITSTMQQQASSLLKINPKATMQCAQRLYEAGHITYMRTDKAVLSDDAKKEGIKWIIMTHGEEYVGVDVKSIKMKGMKTKAKAPEEGVKAQEAHEAIRPTHLNMVELPSTEDWSSIDKKLYRLIWTRALQSLMSQLRGERRTVEFRIDEEWTWRAIWRRVIFDGWRKLDWKEIAEEEEGDDAGENGTEWEFALTLKENTKVSWKSLQAEPHFTKSPARYSEATLIRTLEENGIGRPSTFASLITTILDKNYVEKKTFEAKEIDVETLSLENESEEIVVTPKKQKIGGERDRMVPTALGLSVLKYLMSHFENLFAYEFTASMEKRLDTIAEGQEIWKEVIRDTWKSYKGTYEEQLAIKPTIKDSVGERRREFSGGIIGILTKKGPLLLREMDGDPEKTVFYGWPDKIAFQDITEEKAMQFVESQKKTKEGEEMGELDDKPVIRKKGPYGVYAEWNGKRISCTEASTLEELAEKFENQESNVLRTVGIFEIRKGPYGNYMFKVGVAKKQFVSVPSAVKIEDLTEASCVAIFQAGLQQKARSSSFRGGSRGGFRGGFRGGSRGRGK